MPDSNITKHALAFALKELMEEKPFSKINIAEICEKCGMNRKSFYYHFKDKYDLVNWIFDEDFSKILESRKEDDYFTWPFLEALCECFYENRNFYRKALKIRGQNCFIDHYRECLEPFMQAGMRKILQETEYMDFQISFFADAFVGSLERWLSDAECMPASQLIDCVKACIKSCAEIAEIAENAENAEIADEPSGLGSAGI